MLVVPSRAPFSTLVQSPVRRYNGKGTKHSSMLGSFPDVRGRDRDHEVLAPILPSGLHVVTSNIHEIIGTDPQVSVTCIYS